MIDSGFVAAALAVNALYSLTTDAAERFRNRDIFLADYVAVGPWFDKFLSIGAPILLRVMSFEIVFCVLLLAGIGHDYYNCITRWLLFLPQILLLLFCLLCELAVFLVLCWKGSFKNSRPYWISSIEFIFIMVVFGFIELILPSVFDIVSKRVFQEIRTSVNLVPGDNSLNADITKVIRPEKTKASSSSTPKPETDVQTISGKNEQEPCIPDGSADRRGSGGTGKKT